jgi:hypothetical protein
MNIVVNILFWIHLLSLALGGAAAFGIKVASGPMPSVAPEPRPTLLAIMKGLSNVGRTGIGLLIITGPLLVWLKYGGVGGFTFWFWIKMALVVVLLAGVIYGGILLERTARGGPPSPLLPRLGLINMLVFLAIIFSAVFAFE